MSARVSFMKRLKKDCKDVSIMSLQDEQWKQTSLLCLYTFTKYNRITILNQRIILKDDIEFVTEFPSLYSKNLCLF